MNKVYLVTADLYEQGYGSEIYCLGIFTDRDDAVKCAEYSNSYCEITEIEMNKTYYAIKDSKRCKKSYTIDLTEARYLGGYVE